MRDLLKKHSKYEIILGILIAVYILYFSIFTILRFYNMYASYFDLGIMHQTVFNTYKAITTFDFSRILEMTHPHGGGDQVKRMAVHNDIILAFFAPFYLLYSGPETLLVLQTIILALGSIAVFKIAQQILKNDPLALTLATTYLFYFPMQRANIFDFHAVTIATTTLLFMYYFWLIKQYAISFVFLIISLLTKENIALTTTFFGMYVAYTMWKAKNKDYKFPLAVILVSVVWLVASIVFIMPHYRGGEHFATEYYGNFGDSPLDVIVGIIKNPFSLFPYIFNIDTWRYIWFLLGPTALLSVLSPLHLLIALPEWAINILSTNGNMRNVIYHYTSVLQPFIFIATIYGVAKIINYKLRIPQLRRQITFTPRIIITLLFISTLGFALMKGPLPFSHEADLYPITREGLSKKDVQLWKEYLKDENLKISATGHLGAHFTSRRYFYNFSEDYLKADYILIQQDEALNGFQKDIMAPAYEKLKRDWKFMKIYDKNGLEVYKKVE